MDCRVPGSVIIPAVAARLKYYLDVGRKEAGFDLSVNQKELDGKHRLYQPAGRQKRHRPQGLKENLLDNKLEASFRCYNGKSDWNKVVINPDHKQQVQRRIKKKISSFSVPEPFAQNHIFLRGIQWKDSDWTIHSLGIGRSSTQPVSQEEFNRLISSAANLIVASTLEDHLQCHPQQRSGKRSLTSVHVNITTTQEKRSPNTETSSLDENSDSFCSQNVNLNLLKVPGTSENIDYEIDVYTTAKFQEGTIPSLFIQLYGQRGRSSTLFLQHPLTNITTSSIDQAFTFHVKTRDVGELTDISIGMTKKDKACIWYCKKIIVRKEAKNYVFPYNNWLSSCKTIKAQVMGHVSANTRAQTATYRGTKNHQMKTDKYKASTTKPQHSKDTPCLMFPYINNKTVEKKEDAIKTKSIWSPVVTEGNTSIKTRTVIRKYGPSERRPQGIHSSKKVKVLECSGRTKTSGETSDQVTSMVDRCTTTITSDDSKNQPLLGEISSDDVTSSNTSLDKDETVQNKIQSLKYSRACSPASYVFFAFENKDSSIIVQMNGSTKRNLLDGSMNGNSSVMRRICSGYENTGSQCPGENKRYNSLKGSTELALLQEMISDSGNNVTSGSPDSKPLSSHENSRETRAPLRADDDVSKVHSDLVDINGWDKLCSQLDCEAVKTSGYSCTRGEHSSYETDSTLDEEYNFSDISLDLSLSENDDSVSSSKLDILDTEPEHSQEEHNVDTVAGHRAIQNSQYYDRQKKSKHQICRQQRVESCSENSSIFQRSLDAINNQDDRSLRILCQSHFFLPSITDEEGKTLLHHAAAQENPSTCQVLLDTNIGLLNIDHQDEFGNTALHYAIRKGNPQMIKILLDNGAKAEIPDKKPQTVLDTAFCKVETK